MRRIASLSPVEVARGLAGGRGRGLCSRRPLQRRLREWYRRYMAAKLREIEVALETLPDPMDGSVCQA